MWSGRSDELLATIPLNKPLRLDAHKTRWNLFDAYIIAKITKAHIYIIILYYIILYYIILYYIILYYIIYIYYVYIYIQYIYIYIAWLAQELWSHGNPVVVSISLPRSHPWSWHLLDWELWVNPTQKRHRSLGVARILAPAGLKEVESRDSRATWWRTWWGGGGGAAKEEDW